MNDKMKGLVEKLLRLWCMPDALSDKEQGVLNDELKRSPEAGRLRQVLMDVSQAVKRPTANEPTPAASAGEIWQRAHHGRMAQGRRSRVSALSDMLHFRIPVYQAGLVAFGLGLALFAVGRSSLVDSHFRIQGRRSVSAIQNTVLDSLRSMQGVHMLEHQKRGRNIKQDSVLVKFIITSVDLF